MISQRKIFSYIICLIPLCIIFSFDGSFSIQSIIVPIFLLMILFLVRREIVIDKLMKTAFSLVLLSITVSFFNNIFIGDLPNIYLVRIVYTIIVFLFYLMGTSIVITPKDLTNLLKCSIVSGVLITSYFIFIKKIWYVNLIGVTIDKNFSGALLAIYAQFAFLLMYYGNTRVKKIVYCFLFAYLSIGVFYSGSRAAILVLIIGVVGIYAEDFLIKSKSRKTALKTLVITLSLIVILAIIITRLSQYMMSNSQYQWFWNRYFENSYRDTSNSTRIDYWLTGLKAWTDRPFFGHGPGYITFTKVGSAVAHNTFIDYMVDLGLCGLIAFLLICIRSFKKVLLSRERTYKILPLTLMILGIILSLNRSVLLWIVLIISWQISNMNINFIEYLKGIK